jgi:hypothetical protein
MEYKERVKVNASDSRGRAARIVVLRMMDEPKPQPPQMVEPAKVLAWVRAEFVMQPLSGLEMIRAG